jgi:high-affinity nickel-transport protein
MTVKTMPPQASDVRTRLIAVYSFLLLLNVGGWVCAAFAFHATPVLLGVALLVYGLGLRHAVDADHIAAIDNVTRKLMQAGQRPVAVGFFFAAGHSALIIFATALIIGTATLFDRFQAFSSIGETAKMAISVINRRGVQCSPHGYRPALCGRPALWDKIADRENLVEGTDGLHRRLARPGSDRR